MTMKVFTTGEVLTASDLNIYGVNTIAAVKTSNESVTSSTTFQNDDALVLALAANSTYQVEGTLLTDGASTGDIKFQFTGPAGASLALHWDALGLSATSGGDDLVALMEGFSNPVLIGTVTTGDHRPVSFRGVVVVAATAGNLQLQWAQNASDATASRVLALSYMVARRIS